MGLWHKKWYRQGRKLTSVNTVVHAILSGEKLFLNEKVQNAAFLQNLQLRLIANYAARGYFRRVLPPTSTTYFRGRPWEGDNDESQAANSGSAGEAQEG